MKTLSTANVRLYLIIIGCMYAVLGFSIGINAYFIPFVQEAFTLKTATSYLIMTATFSAYVLFAIPSAMLLKKIGYRNSICTSFFILASGFTLIAFSSQSASFELFLFGLFVLGIAQTLLTDSINSYVTILGSPESAAKRISIMGIADKLALAGASFILALFLDLKNVDINHLKIPFYSIAAIAVLVGVAIYFSPLPEISAPGEDSESSELDASVYGNTKSSIFHIPHLYLGAIAIFFDVGVEIIALGSINDYAKSLNLEHPEHYVWYTTFGMVFGYLCGVSLIPKRLSQRQGLVICTLLGIVTTIVILIVEPIISIYLGAALGFANSLLWPTVFPLALRELGRFTKKGASVLVMGIIGGAVLPLIFGYLADLYEHQIAYSICIPAYLYLLFYALIGSKLRPH
ncbi:MAG: MFS transporter [Sphingobacterium hotanense]